MTARTRVITLNKRMGKIKSDNDAEKIKTFIYELPFELREKYGITNHPILGGITGLSDEDRETFLKQREKMGDTPVK